MSRRLTFTFIWRALLVPLPISEPFVYFPRATDALGPDPRPPRRAPRARGSCAGSCRRRTTEATRKRRGNARRSRATWQRGARREGGWRRASSVLGPVFLVSQCCYRQNAMSPRARLRAQGMSEGHADNGALVGKRIVFFFFHEERKMDSSPLEPARGEPLKSAKTRSLHLRAA